MEIRIPARYSEIPLARFIAYHAGKSDVQKIMGITGANYSDVVKLTPASMKIIREKVDEVLSLKTVSHPKRIRIGGKELGFVPDLTDLTVGEWADISAHVSQIWGKELNYEKLPDLLAILYRPITERIGSRYRVEEYDASVPHKELLSDLTMDKVSGATLFFSTIRKKLLAASLPFLETQMTKQIAEVVGMMTEAMEEASQSNGDGITPYSYSPATTS